MGFLEFLFEGLGRPNERLRLVSRMARYLKFVFQFPPIHGVFDTGSGTVYVFGDQHEDEIEDVLMHETLHYVIQKVAGKRASLKLDKVYGKIVR